MFIALPIKKHLAVFIPNTPNRTGVTNTNEQSNYQFVKQGWGSRPNFQYSFGLKMDPDGIEEGNAIIEAFRQQDAQEGRK
ncbi:hypothetical protein AJ79_05265 [Helicocarpus griseus UAMH5409]|uniref:Uncharacterized protein n=1 Tax=Helicocarpus griseus UAMH5409 TaxID=1447875 RepID=A0A2B7XQ64_9EURO|nr:hypothetical protein AJ79_05265 [Helicocarpus griseus UAMH5409]